MNPPPGLTFPYVTRAAGIGRAGTAPMLPLRLTLGGTSIPVSGLLDSGASMSVLPHTVGLRLGAVWARQTVPVPLGGTLVGGVGRALTVIGAVGSFAPVPLLFAWAATDTMPIILGRTNFFLAFDVCFYGSRAEFDIRPAAAGP